MSTQSSMSTARVIVSGCAAGRHPPSRLAGDRGDPIVVLVEVRHRDAGSLADGRDQQIRDADISLVTGPLCGKVSWLMRQADRTYAPNLLPFILGLVGVVLALVTAWLGGELVYRLRVAVDDDANLDASNSLSQEGAVSADGGRTAG
jgi:hypothetical protein